jgi:hypothetical protein
VLGAVALAVALAAAIAFGWGARNVAQDIVEKAYNRRHEATQGASNAGRPATAETAVSEAGDGQSAARRRQAR